VPIGNRAAECGTDEGMRQIVHRYTMRDVATSRERDVALIKIRGLRPMSFSSTA
jgi:hypothetical protein